MSKVIVLTGATNGIGERSAHQLAAAGHRIVLVARNEKKAQAVIASLPTPQGQKHSYHLADMSVIGDIKRVAKELVMVEPHIDVLINNAGALFDAYGETSDGIERTIAVNHVAYFVLTLSLKSSLGKYSRVVNTSSHLHRRSRFESDNMALKRGQHFGLLHGFDNYNKSKLYNVLFTRYLSQKWSQEEITVNCLHPGLIRSGFGSGQWGIAEPIAWLLMLLFGRTAEAGGEIITWLATSPNFEGVTGRYYNRFNSEEPSSEALDECNGEVLWRQSLAWAQMSDNAS